MGKKNAGFHRTLIERVVGMQAGPWDVCSVELIWRVLQCENSDRCACGFLLDVYEEWVEWLKMHNCSIASSIYFAGIYHSNVKNRNNFATNYLLMQMSWLKVPSNHRVVCITDHLSQLWQHSSSLLFMWIWSGKGAIFNLQCTSCLCLLSCSFPWNMKWGLSQFSVVFSFICSCWQLPLFHSLYLGVDIAPLSFFNGCLVLLVTHFPCRLP